MKLLIAVYDLTMNTPPPQSFRKGRILLFLIFIVYYCILYKFLQWIYIDNKMNDDNIFEILISASHCDTFPYIYLI